MIGIHVSKNVGYSDEHANLYYEYEGYKLTLSYHKGYKKQVSLENNEILILIDGWLFCGESYETQAEYLYDLYKRYGTGISVYLNGQFNILIADKIKKEIYFVNDIFAFRRHFLRNTGAEILISSDYNFLLGQSDKIGINESHIRKSINQPRFVDINATYINSIKQITPNTFVSILQNNIQNYDTAILKKKYGTEFRFDLKWFTELIQVNIAKVHRNEQILLELSGGLDSRFLLELFKKVNINTETLSYGTVISDEVIIAANTAKLNNVNHYEINLNPEDYITNAEDYVLSTGGMDLFVQSSANTIFRKLRLLSKTNFVLDTGFALDAYLGGTQIARSREVPAFNFSGEAFNLSTDNIYSEIFRIFSVLTLRQIMHRENLEDRYSMYSYENYFLMRSIPEDYLTDYAFYLPLARHVITNSRCLPLQETMLSIDLDYEYWNEAAKIASQKELFSRKLYRDQKKTIYHNRHYTDFDMWLRADSKWAEITENYLLGNKVKLKQYFREEKAFTEMVDAHLQGESNNIRYLIKWISLEMFLRAVSK